MHKHFKAGLGSRNPRISKSQLSFAVLEPRQLMAGDLSSSFLTSPVTPATPEIISEDFGFDDARQAELAAEFQNADRISVAIPTTIGDTIEIDIQVNSEIQTLVLERASSTRSDNFQVLLQQDDGSFVEFDTGQENNFVGSVAGIDGLSVAAVISSRGLTAEVRYADGRLAWNIAPDDVANAVGGSVHAVTFTDTFDELEALHDHNGDGIADHAAGAHDDGAGGHPPDCACAACAGQLSDVPSVNNSQLNRQNETDSASQDEQPAPLLLGGFAGAGDDPASRARLFNEVQVREAVIGFDVTNEALREGYSNNVQSVVDNISLFLITDERASAATTSPNAIFLRDALVRQVAGTIIIRTSLDADPYADDNGNADINGTLLNRFRDRWNGDVDTNNNDLVRRGEVNRLQSDHTLATLLGGSAGSADGLAFVGTLNETSRYSISDGSNPNFWRAVARHEIGHTYGLAHFGGSGRRAEFDPGGNGVGIFDPTGLRNRLTTDELASIRAEIDSSNLPLINAGTSQAGNFSDHEVRPRPLRDDVEVARGSLAIDVLANDFDANNDPLFIQTFDETTEQGGTVTRSIGTGDQGQDVLIYTPPENFSGTDTFYYFAAEPSGFRSFALVSIDVTGPTTIDTSETEFFYDLGAPDSVLFSNGVDPYQILSADTFGDVGFIGGSGVNFDRGSGPGVNNINRDGIIFDQSTTFNHVLADGVYSVVFNIGDAEFARDEIVVTAEGETVFADIDRSVGEFTTLRFDVTVTDGELNLGFEDLGGVNDEISITRIILSQESPIITVDTTETVFFYDIGAADSVLFDNGVDPYQRLPANVSGDVSFTGGNGVTFDRGGGPGVNAINRDGAIFTGNTTFNHLVADGIYTVTLNIGDADFVRDNIEVTAEGQTIFADIDRDAGQFTTLNFRVEITDGELNLGFNDFGGANNEISITRIILRQDTPIVTVDTSQTEFFYDLGSPDSVLFDNGVDPYQRLSSNILGDISFTGGNGVTFDRGAGPGVNAINRDGVIFEGETTFNHVLADGRYNIIFNIGDADFARDNITVSAEGQTLFTDIDRAPNQFDTLSAQIDVTDGELNFAFEDFGGENNDISITRIILQRIGDAALPDATIEGRFVFYNNSSFDGDDDAANAADDNAIATDKVALLPGETATFENYTSFSRGLNGVIIDIANLADPTSLSASDFVLATGNGSQLSDFTTLDVIPEVNVRIGEGTNGSDRITLTLPDNIVQDTYLQVNVLANETTGLESNDLFYFGNAIGETGNSTTDARVSVADVFDVRANFSGLFDSADIENNFDFDRSGRVTIVDLGILRQNFDGLFDGLNLITAPGGGLPGGNILGVSTFGVSQAPGQQGLESLDALTLSLAGQSVESGTLTGLTFLGNARFQFSPNLSVPPVDNANDSSADSSIQSTSGVGGFISIDQIGTLSPTSSLIGGEGSVQAVTDEVETELLLKIDSIFEQQIDFFNF